MGRMPDRLSSWILPQNLWVENRGTGSAAARRIIEVESRCDVFADVPGFVHRRPRPRHHRSHQSHRPVDGAAATDHESTRLLVRIKRRVSIGDIHAIIVFAAEEDGRSLPGRRHTPRVGYGPGRRSSQVGRIRFSLAVDTDHRTPLMGVLQDPRPKSGRALSPIETTGRSFSRAARCDASDQLVNRWSNRYQSYSTSCSRRTTWCTRSTPCGS
jgi:hypothetical protein